MNAFLVFSEGRCECMHDMLCCVNLNTSLIAVYLNFGGENLPTNSYVSISQLGNTTDTALVCRTDQSGDSGGGWFNPSGTMVEFNANSSQGFYTQYN